MKISKELLSEVLEGLELDYEYPIEFYNNKNAFRYWVMESPKYQSTSEYINIYELAFKIEDWIESKDINIIRIKENKLYEFYINAYIDEETNELFFENSITSETKINGIIAVGEFILKEINEKQLQH